MQFIRNYLFLVESECSQRARQLAAVQWEDYRSRDLQNVLWEQRKEAAHSQSGWGGLMKEVAFVY